MGGFNGAWLDRHGIRPPSGSGGPSSAVGLTSLPVVDSHAESAAMLADPMVGYWCRVGVTSIDAHSPMTSPFWSSGEHCSASFCYPPTARCTKGVGCVSSVNCQDWSLLLRECGQGLVPWSEVVSGALHHCFVCSECMPVMSCIGLQSPAWVVGLFSDATCISPHDHFDGIGLYPKPCPGFGSLPKPCSCYLSNHLGEKQLTSVSSCSVSTIGVVVVYVSGDSTAMCSVNFDLRTRFFRVGFAATCPAAAWFSGLNVSP